MKCIELLVRGIQVNTLECHAVEVHTVAVYK